MVLDQEMPRPFDVTREILEDTYDLLLDTGYYIQPWPLEKGSLDDHLSHPDPQISRAVLRDGRRIGSASPPHRPRHVMLWDAHGMTDEGSRWTTSKHGRVVRRFGQQLVKRRLLPRALGTSLNQMLELRQKADYGSTGVTSLDAERA